LHATVCIRERRNPALSIFLQRGQSPAPGNLLTAKSISRRLSPMALPTRVGGEREDRFTGAIESQTSKIPSTGYLALAIGSMAASAVLKIIGRDDWSLFVGQWAPSFLIIGVYNKLVKQQGSDAYSSRVA
jgi:hypothetical protein